MKSSLKRINLSIWIILFFSFCSSSPEGIIILCAGDSITRADYPVFEFMIFHIYNE